MQSKRVTGASKAIAYHTPAIGNHQSPTFHCWKAFQFFGPEAQLVSDQNPSLAIGLDKANKKPPQQVYSDGKTTAILE